MINIIAEGILPSKNKNAFLELSKPLVEASQKEYGNIFYHLHECLEDTEKIAFIECWADQSAIDSHNASKHFTTIFPQLNELLSQPLKITLYKTLL